MKYDTYSEYDPHRTALAESAFLTIWAGLRQWHSDLVLVGGLVPKYLCGDVLQPRQLPRPATLDVDFGISLGTDSGQYGSLEYELSGQGFRQNAENTSRLEKVIGGVTVPIDFLVEYPPRVSGTTHVDGIVANVMPGVKRALQTARLIEVSGVDLHGAEQTMTARVCDIGPFLALKLRAFCHRQQPKDAFDILYTILHYDGGIEAAIAAFAEEVRLENPACPDALETLAQDFQSPASPGPAKASHFVCGDRSRNESEDSKFIRNTIRQDMVDAAAKLIAASN